MIAHEQGGSRFRDVPPAEDVHAVNGVREHPEEAADDEIGAQDEQGKGEKRDKGRHDRQPAERVEAIGKEERQGAGHKSFLGFVPGERMGSPA